LEIDRFGLLFCLARIGLRIRIIAALEGIDAISGVVIVAEHPAKRFFIFATDFGSLGRFDEFGVAPFDVLMRK